MKDFNFSNMHFQIGEAVREAVKVKVAITGPSGSGKTVGALLMAHGLVDGDWGSVCFADTENRSALYYAGQTINYRDRTGNKAVTIGNFKHLPINPPYDPRMFVQMIRFVQKQGFRCLIIDSASHEWDGAGGCLDLQESFGGRYQDWARVTPLHREFIDEMRNSDMHVIVTMRSKQEYALEEQNGKKTVTKLGMKAQQRDGTDYEFGIVFDVDSQHYAKAAKDRTGIFSTATPFMLSPFVGETLRNWAGSGAKTEIQAPPPRMRQEDVFDDSVYSGLDSQKKLVVGICTGLGIKNRDHWKTISDDCIGTPIETLPDAVASSAQKLGLMANTAPANPQPATEQSAKQPTPQPTNQPAQPKAENRPSEKAAKEPKATPALESQPSPQKQPETPIITGTVETAVNNPGVFSQRVFLLLKSELLKARGSGALTQDGFMSAARGLEVIRNSGQWDENEVLERVKGGDVSFLRGSDPEAAQPEPVQVPVQNEPEPEPTPEPPAATEDDSEYPF